MNVLSQEKRTQIIRCLVEGNSIRATVRMTGASKNTIAKLLIDLGAACSEYMNRTLVNLTCKRVQCDEIWSFVYAKAKNVTPEIAEKVQGAGDVWTWVAMDADTKLVASWLVAGRDAGSAYEFMQDLAKRLSNRVQLTTDGHRAYLTAVEDAFGGGVDYAMLVKIYGAIEGESRYSPAECISCREVSVSGRPDPKHISTSHIERQNLTMRMQMRRFTRLTNGFSKKIENHIAHTAIHFMHYNFCRVHQSLRVTPAMEAGIADHVWNIGEMLSMLDAKVSESKAA
jgi:IS1 family transposase